MTNTELLKWLNEQLQPGLIKDYCPNGLQVEGKSGIAKVVTGVTASMALIDAAIERNADAILVHHGYFWKGEKSEIVGMKQQRIKKLLQQNINLFAYHLPLDVHPEFGNNASLGKLFGLSDIRAIGHIKPTGIVMQGKVEEEQNLQEFASLVEKTLNRQPLVIGDALTPIKAVAWCTGGGQSFIDQVLDQDIDLFISGEASEQTVHTAREMGICFISAGHHATERYGVKHLGEKLAAETSLDVEFVDIDNPV